MEKNTKIIISLAAVFLVFAAGLIFKNYFLHADAASNPVGDISSILDNGKLERHSQSVINKEKKDEKEEEKSKADHGLEFEYPDAVRGLYLTGHTAGHPTRFDELVEYINETDLNSVVIDIKDDWGNITFKMEEEPHKEYSENYISDPREVLETLEENDIYPIARIVVFKDTNFAKDNPDKSFREPGGGVWTNRSGEAYVNPFSKEIWEYNLEIAKKAANLGFQDIQFDYVRFPEGFENRDERLEYSFGDYEEDKLMPRIEEEWDKEYETHLEEAEEKAEKKLDELDEEEEEQKENNKEEAKTSNEEKSSDKKEKEEEKEEEKPEPPEYSYGLARTQAISDFVEYAYEELQSYDVDVSVDIFGYTAVDMDTHGIGQNFLEISENVDVISSMIYPSHWGAGYFGIDYPDKEPYRLVDEYAVRENKILEQLENPPISRPWIQDFTASWLRSGTYISYGIEEVEAQIKALNDNGIEEFLIWDANNRYTKGVDYTP